ncbi:MAG TPA: NYN domain-containing protein [Candidatus Saccharimonadales bacterium]|nr:NYN domain-containing protein [Candidatus Saccharimonadales bacterium]
MGNKQEPTISIKSTAGVYIDGSNIYHGGKVAGWQMSYPNMKSFLERKYTLTAMSYYNSTGYAQDKKGGYLKNDKGEYITDPGALRFENTLRGLGIRVVTKPLKFIEKDEQKPSNKMDGDLMVDSVMESQKWETLVLLSGDCDFERLVKQMVSNSQSVHIFSFESRMSHELKMLSLQSPYVTYTPIDDLRSVLEYVRK